MKTTEEIAGLFNSTEKWDDKIDYKKWFSVEELVEAFNFGKNDTSLEVFKERFGL